MIVSPYDNLSMVYAADPVNRQHPLNQGRVAWWLTLPELAGGRQFFDLMGLSHGTLTSMGNASNGWRSTTRPGGSGHIVADGSAGNVTAPCTVLNGASQATLACWVYKASNAVTVGGGGVNSPSIGADRFSFIWFTDGNLYASAGTPYGFASQSDFVWHRIVLVFDGTTTGNANRLKIYTDGVQKSLSFAGGTINATLPNISPYILGKDATDRFTAGAYDDFTIWNRSLSASDVIADYGLSRRGYPDVLNRFNPAMVIYSIPSSVRISPYWYARNVHQ